MKASKGNLKLCWLATYRLVAVVESSSQVERMVCLAVITDFAHLEKGAICIHHTRFLLLIVGIFRSPFFPVHFQLSAVPMPVTFLKVILQL